MKIPSGSTDRRVPFVAVDVTDLKTRETGLSGFTVYRSRDAGAATAYTTPTVAEASAANMPGLYWLTIDEDTTIGAGHDDEVYVVHITHASMSPVTLALMIERVKFTEGQSATMANNAVDADIERLQGSVIATPTVAGVLEVDVTHWIGTAAATPTVAGVPEVDITHFNGVAGTFASGRPEVNVSHWRGTAAAVPTTAGVPAVEAIDISAAGQTDIRSAVGLATANLDTQLAAIGGFIDTEVSTIVTQTSAASIRSAVGLASANLDTQLAALPTAAENAAELLATAADGAVTVVQSLRLANSALGGKLSGAGTGTEAVRDLADSKDRLVYTVDTDGNRSAVARDLT